MVPSLKRQVKKWETLNHHTSVSRQSAIKFVRYFLQPRENLNPSKMFKFAVLVVLAVCVAATSAIGYYDGGLGYGAYSLYNGGVAYGIGSYGGHGIHGLGGYRGALPYGGVYPVGLLG